MHLWSTNIAEEQEDRGCLRLKVDAQPLTDLKQKSRKTEDAFGSKWPPSPSLT
jgi:hypothetical protein